VTGEPRYWIWVFGEIAGLRWVLAERTMAFRSTVAPRLRAMAEGDHAILYVGRSAFHSPTRDVARLAGLATVLAPPAAGASVTINSEEFAWTVPIRVDLALPERTGPEVRPLVGSLSFVRRPEVWGMYFRSSPQEIPEGDFRVLADAVEAWGKGA
jgi:hypothetical protein